MNISYDSYRVFYYAAKYKSFSQAAAALYNDQPNVTRMIRRLESELRCPLFFRSPQGVRLTPEGEKLYTHIAAAFESIAAGEAELLSGVAITDDLVMGAIRDYCGGESAAPQALMAGADLLIVSDLPADYAALRQAVKEGRVSMERLDEAVLRVLELKEKLGLLS